MYSLHTSFDSTTSTSTAPGGIPASRGGEAADLPAAFLAMLNSPVVHPSYPFSQNHQINLDTRLTKSAAGRFSASPPRATIAWSYAVESGSFPTPEFVALNVAPSSNGIIR